MSIEIRVPMLGESVTEATVGKWFKQAGDPVRADEPLVELETDKVTVEVPAPASGVLGDILVQSGSTVAVGSLLAALKDGAANTSATSTPPKAPPPQPQPEHVATKAAEPAANTTVPPPPPAARKALAESGFEASEVAGSGRRGQVLKEDVINAVAAAATRPSTTPSPQDAPNSSAPTNAVAVHAPQTIAMRDLRLPSAANDVTREERVKMSKLRQTIARRLKEAQSTAAMLTTFNDVDMSAIMALRTQYKDVFEKRHGVKLGFMGLFVKACIQALRDVPSVNAEIDGDEIVYKNYYHIGVAVGTEKGLVVPVVRDADQLSLAGVEQRINEFGKRARDGKLSIEDMQGGTFTISNGGVYGSLMSTPILNAPQSGILGMHRIEERPVVRNGQVVARPMMYLALSYDHRLVDGKEAVTFLVRVKECLEDPQRFILEL
ncbi:2-oxoglutarate dehydrogenase complex dihydrolipoyllysine-residue succinyltransferase [Hyphomicrobium sp.]|jgi:2-oxoglutarate dehydrogenase E2 component (dihydrolipoamide succinyltransferase)|uniref:2-oxoglutarate dehydrogenase complex dihydrolipoyllysine-residue succinyltransferase n=1 Tax=Hyphomicrobium sp. TaxID=82 RepID=UPI002BAD90D1|nr:2-oxoglutarate dehydrogenase complex dihydrolipoyllysine-residue succinyltransferase [Hyphomicrobium sp.]HVZ04877.1 2-oxoglutarate dehydrogenase complex dihydrolipoyllysine-residue succinyltransferase [Hyphomicrobium sp.]